MPSTRCSSVVKHKDSRSPVNKKQRPLKIGEKHPKQFIQFIYMIRKASTMAFTSEEHSSERLRDLNFIHVDHFVFDLRSVGERLVQFRLQLLRIVALVELVHGR